jgi:hypothetical protein
VRFALIADIHGNAIALDAIDHNTVIAAVRRVQHPAARLIIDHQLGDRTVEGMVAEAKRRHAMIVARPGASEKKGQVQ